MLKETIDFLKMNVEELYDKYVTFVLSNPQSKDVMGELFNSSRYLSDFEFRAMVDFSMSLKDAVVKDYKELNFSKRIIKCIDLIDRTTALEMWQLVANLWNILALSYSNLVMYERALECFSHAIRTEKEHELYKLSPIIYTNMVDIFIKIEEYEKALGYIQKAVEILELHQHEIPRYWDKYVGIYTRYLFLKIRKGQYRKEDIKPCYDRIMAVPEKEINFNTNRSKLAAQFYYGFFYAAEEEWEKLFQQVKELFGGHQTMLFCQECIEMAELVGKNKEPLILKLVELEEEGLSNFNLQNMSTYDILMNYYESQENFDKVSEYQVKYIKSVKAHLKELAEQKNYAINTIEELIMSDEFKHTNQIKNVEFKLIAEETLRAKRELEEANAILSKISSLDGLTQISSRRDFEERFHNLLLMAEKKKCSIAVFMMDIDNFKQFNDTYGHLEGDKTLKIVAKNFSRNFSGNHQLSARFGGEEFIGAVTGLTIQETEKLARKICEDIEDLKLEHRSAHLGYVTVSLGVSFAKQVNPEMKSELMKHADECLYTAKAKGKNTYAFLPIEAY